METKEQELYERLLKEFLEWQAEKAKQEQEKAVREEILGYPNRRIRLSIHWHPEVRQDLPYDKELCG